MLVSVRIASLLHSLGCTLESDQGIQSTVEPWLSEASIAGAMVDLQACKCLSLHRLLGELGTVKIKNKLKTGPSLLYHVIS